MSESNEKRKSNKDRTPSKNSSISLEDVAAMLTTLSSRLDTIEFKQNEMNQKQDRDIDEKVKRRSTMVEAALPRTENTRIQNTIQIPPFEYQLTSLSPRAVIRFISQAQVYQASYNTLANLSKSISHNVSLTLIAASEDEFNINNIGTITLDRLVHVIKLHLKIHTQQGLLIQMKKNAKFPYSDIKEINQKTFPEFRSLLKQYINDFIMLFDLLATNESTIPPISTSRENGLLNVFHYPIPFDFGSGVYNQIGYDGPKKIQFNSIHEYVQKFNERIDEFFKIANQLQPLYDAILKPDKLPVPRPSKVVSDEFKYVDETKSIGTKASDLTSSFTTNPEVTAIIGNTKPLDNSQLPCHGFALKKVCTRDPCPWSHDLKIIQKYLDSLRKDLS